MKIKIWKNDFNFNKQATESDTKSNKVQTSILMACNGNKGREIYSTFTFDSPVQALFNKFDTFCQQRKNLTITRHRLFTSKQAENQKFNDYMTQFCHKAQESKQEQLTENLIQNVLICRIKDSKLRERLLMQPELYLLRTIQVGQSTKETKIQIY